MQNKQIQKFEKDRIILANNNLWKLFLICKIQYFISCINVLFQILNSILLKSYKDNL